MAGERVPYRREVWEATTYPVRWWPRALLLLGLSAGLAFLRFFPWEGRVRRNPLPFLFVLLVAYAVSYLFHVAVEGSGEEEYRGNPLLQVEFEEALRNLGQFFGAFAISFLPVIGLAVYVAMDGGRPFQDVPFLALLGGASLAGAAYFPMAILLLGFSGTWVAAFNLPLGFRSIARIGPDYWTCFGFFAVFLGVSALLEVYGVAPREPWSLGRLLALSAAALAEVYLAVVAMRAVGRLFRASSGRLGWEAGRGA